MPEAKEEHFVGKVAQKAIIMRADEVLLVRGPAGEEGNLGVTRRKTKCR